MAAGKYKTFFVWHVHAYTAADTFGEKGDGYTQQAYAWGEIENEQAGTTETLNSAQAQSTATIRLRQLHAVKPLDQLREVYSERVWTVSTARQSKDDNETICEVTS